MDLCKTFYSTGISDFWSNKQNQHNRSWVFVGHKIIGNYEKRIHFNFSFALIRFNKCLRNCHCPQVLVSDNLNL